MKYFMDCTCIEDVKQLYKQLCFTYHPDVTGTDTTAQMQEINSEYEIVFNRYKDIHKNVKGETYTSTESTTEKANDFAGIINQIIAMQGIKIELIGSWIWVTGNTFPYKDTLRSIGFKWCSNKKAWTYHRPDEHKKTNRKLSLDEIRGLYGSNEVKTEYRPLIA